MFEYDAFRCNVLENLDDSAFNRPICEALLNQKYFNGVGNYLRAEILFRVGTPPFTCARKVLEALCESGGTSGSSKEDILWFCHKLPCEVVSLNQKVGQSDTLAMTEEHFIAFSRWLQCYENPDMNTIKDHIGRTIWFKGEAGAMCPKHQKSRRPRKRKRKRKRPASDSTVHEIKSEDPAPIINKVELVEVKEEYEDITEMPQRRKRRRRVVVKHEAKKTESVFVKKEDERGGSTGGSKSGDDAPGKRHKKRNRRPAPNELVNHYSPDLHQLHTFEQLQ
jgi:endonuclease VIII-like 1